MLVGVLEKQDQWDFRAHPLFPAEDSLARRPVKAPLHLILGALAYHWRRISASDLSRGAAEKPERRAARNSHHFLPEGRSYGLEARR